MRAASRLFCAAGLIGAAACAAMATSTPGPVAPSDRAIRIEARRVPLGIGGATLAPGVTWAGGLAGKGSGTGGAFTPPGDTMVEPGALGIGIGGTGAGEDDVGACSAVAGTWASTPGRDCASAWPPDIAMKATARAGVQT